MKEFLLFIEIVPIDHDLVITDFVHSFNTPDEAMDWYDTEFGKDEKWNTGAIVKCDEEWQVQYRTQGASKIESIYRTGWADGWGTANRNWEGVKNPYIGEIS